MLLDQKRQVGRVSAIVKTMRNIDWKKYILVLVITASLFILANALSNWIASKKVDSLKNIQNKIATDILSSETQYSLLSELSCQDVDETNLSGELNSLAEKIEYSEQNLKGNDEVTELKKYYTLLQIKDFLLMNKVNERCGRKAVGILYFYTTADNCTECTKQGFVLTELRKKYPSLRVYSFDYNLDLSALSALKRIYKIEDTKLPALIINEKKYTGFQTTEAIEKMIPDLKRFGGSEKTNPKTSVNQIKNLFD